VAVSNCRSFDRSFLNLPEEVLVTVMRDHQKYFAVEDGSGKLLPHFLAVLNTEGDPDGLIRHGNERVLRARFNDAQFFWNADQKIPLRDRVDLLKNVTFQKDLGSYYDKSQRVAKLAEEIAQNLNDMGAKADAATVAEAAWLSKADLTTELVRNLLSCRVSLAGSTRGPGREGTNRKRSLRPIQATVDGRLRPRTVNGAVPFDCR